MNQVICSLSLAFLILFSNSYALAAKSDSSLSVSKQTLAAAERIDVNSADAESIANAMTGIGLKKAQAIVSWRKANGKFTSIDQLVEVKGIGAAILAKNRDRLLIK